MKKQITLLSGLLLATGAFAQNAKVTALPRMAQTISTANHKTVTASTPKALGTVVVGGLMFSLVLTLFVIPSVYTYLSSKHKKQID